MIDLLTHDNEDLFPMLELQWHLFPLQLIALFFAYQGWRKTSVTLMILSLILAALCFSTHVTNTLSISL